MAGDTECSVYFGSSIQMRWRRTQDGAICVFLRHSAQGVPSSQVLQLRSQQSDAVAFGAVGAGLRCNPLDITDNHSTNDHDVRKLREKIEREWESRRKILQQSAETWSANPGTFFGNTDFTSSEHCSFKFLNDARKILHRERAPFHKANLSKHLQRRLEHARVCNPEFLEKTCRRTMIAEMNPNLEELTEADRKALYRRFERYTQHGNILLKVGSLGAGLLLTVAPSLTTMDFGLISKHLESASAFQLPWLTSEIIEASRQYNALSSRILAYMHADPEQYMATFQGHDYNPASWCQQANSVREQEQPTFGTPSPVYSTPSLSPMISEQHYIAPNIPKPLEGLSQAPGFFRERLPGRIRLTRCQDWPYEERLLDFYLHHLTPTRTLFESNLYLEILQSCEYEACVRFAIFTLAASYLKDANEPQYRCYALQNLQFCVGKSTLSSLQIRSILGATALLLQSTVISTVLQPQWISHVQALPILLQCTIQYPQSLSYRMRLAAHHVLANTVAGPATMFKPSAFLSDQEKSVQDIDGLIGLSPELLAIIQDVTMLSDCSSGKSLKHRLLMLIQNHSNTTLSMEVRYVIQLTAETYRLSTLLFLNWKIPGTLALEEIVNIEDALVEALEFLPTSGPLYTALHPLWSLFICSVTVVRHRPRVEVILDGFTYPPTSNIAPAIDAIRRIWSRSPTSWQEVTNAIGCYLSLT